MKQKMRNEDTFRFDDPREHEIYENLLQIGPGPSAFYRDACKLMKNKEYLSSTTHIIAHLMREIESSLRDVLKPLSERITSKETTAKENSKETHRDEIRAILELVGVRDDEPIVKTWFDFSEKSHKFTHRDNLELPRPIDQEFEEFWRNAETVFYAVSNKWREKFFGYVKILDELLKKCPSQSSVDKLKKEIPNNLVALAYFLDRCQDPGWIEPLKSKGFFLHPPKPQRDDERSIISLPPWPQSRYLARMASLKPEVVLEVILQIPDTDNVLIYQDLVDAALQMLPEVAVRLIEKAKVWACSSYQSLLPEKLGELVAHLARGGKVEAALDLARVLLEILPDPQVNKASTEETHPLLPKPRARFDTWNYERILKKDFLELIKTAGIQAIVLLCHLLESAIRLSQTGKDNQGPEDYSSIWRPDIENCTNDTLKDVLVNAVLDNAKRWVEINPLSIQEIVSLLEERSWRIFQRIALYLLRCFPNTMFDLVVSRLTNQSLFEEPSLRHEYDLLVGECFRFLTREQQRIILGWIEHGPDLQKFKEVKEQRTGKEPTDNDAIQYKKIWQRDRLSWFKTDFPEDWRQRYEAMVAEYGEPNPSLLAGRTFVRTGLDSPKSTEELQAMPVMDIVSFLRAWDPPKDFIAPSPEGIRPRLSSAVSHDPERFAREAVKFQGLDPTYVRGLLLGLCESVKQNCLFDWEPVFALCLWIMDQPREIEGRHTRTWESDPDWGWTRATIVDLFSEGFKETTGGFSFAHRSIVWKILYLLTNDPDPTPAREGHDNSSDMDPATLSINTTRGEAMHAVVQYALWVRRHLEKLTDGKERLIRGFDEMPEVRETLDQHLDVSRDSSLAVRAVYGQWFPWLVLLDPDWARSRAPRVFPHDESGRIFCDAAWGTYIVLCAPYNNVFEILRDQYAVMVERLGSSQWRKSLPADPKKTLAEHLMTFYWRGELDIHGCENILTRFWINADNSVRGHAIEFVGRSLRNTKETVPPEILMRLQTLWERRLQAAQAGSVEDYKSELAAFGWWFVAAKFDNLWAMTQLAEALKIAGETDPDDLVVKRLATFGQIMPGQTLQCLEAIIKGDREGWFVYSHKGDIRKVLMALQDSKAKENLINYMGSRGYLEFRDLLQKR